MDLSGPHCTQPPVSILYAEPDDRWRSQTVAAVESANPGIAVETVETSAALRTRLATDPEKYSCILTEYQFDTTNVLQLFEELQCETGSVILYTADGDEWLASQAFTVGMAGYVPKTHPGAIEAVLDRIRTVVETDTTRRRPVETMHEIALEFESCSSIDAAYRIAVESMMQLLDGYESAMFVERESPVFTSTRAENTLVAASTAGVTDERSVIDDSRYRSIAEQADRSGLSSVIDPTTYTDPADRPERGPTIRSVLSVPIDSIGVLQTVSTEPDAFDDVAIKHVELVAAHVASTVERLRSERALRTERDRFASLFENVPDAVALRTHDDGGRVLDVNPAFETIFGYDRETIVGNPLDEYILPPDADPIRIYEEAGLEGVVTTELERLTAVGRGDFLFRGFAVESDEGIHEYTIYTDITEQKRRERELERYRTLVQTVGDPMYVLDPQGRVEMVNDAMAEAIGASHEDLVGTNVREHVPSADVKRGFALIDELVSEETRRWGTYEMTLKPIDSAPYLAENNVAPLVEDGDVVGSVGVVRDISDRKERERRIRRLHDGTRQLMAAEDAHDVAETTTEIARDALDIRINAIYLYDETADGLVPVAVTDDVETVIDAVSTIDSGGDLAWEAYETGETISHSDVRDAETVRNPETAIRSEAHIPLGDNGVFIISSTEPDAFDEAELTLAKILAANVEAALQRAQRESELATRTQELERQNDRLEAFAGTVSHDLRNPLTLANGHLQALRTHVDNGGHAHVEEIEWALDRMEDLIEDVLLLARSGKQLTETEQVELDAVVERAHRTVDPTLDVHIETGLPAVAGDKNRLLVCFENLFRNAREHVGEDATVTITGTDDGFAVADDGTGIPESEREAVLQSGYSTAEDGTGFGLAIVSEVIEAHGWSISVGESDAGGVRFDVSIDAE